MAGGFLWEEYKAEWTVNLSNSVSTPMCTPSRWNDFLLWFEVQYTKQDSTQYNYSFNRNETVWKDSLEIIANGNFSKTCEPNLVMFLTVCYNCNSCNEELKNFKLISDSPFNRLSVGEVNSTISTDGNKTNHGNRICSGSILLKCHLFISGHLGSFSSHFEMKSSLNNQSNFLKDFCDIYYNKTCSDIDIRIDDKTISAHKLVLVAHSPVFKKMMEHDCLESRTNEITITDASYEVFECFLEFLYYGHIPYIFSGDIGELHALADKYDVGPLKEECLRRMVKDISVKNVCKILPLVYGSKDEEVINQVKYFAVQNFIQLKSTPEWMDLVKSHLQICYSITEQVCDNYIKRDTACQSACDDVSETE